jgi:hypothetical protein
MLVSTSVILAQIAVSANDNKVVLVNGMGTVVQNPAPDTVAIIDLKQFPTKIIAEIEVPARVVGPRLSVAITHETRWQQAGGCRSAPQDEGGPCCHAYGREATRAEHAATFVELI